MPYYNFEDTQKAAKFLASLDFTIFDTSQGDFTPEHVMYHCTLSYGGESFNTTYQSTSTASRPSRTSSQRSRATPRLPPTMILMTSLTSLASRSPPRQFAPTRVARRALSG